MKLFVWDLHGVLEKGNDLAVLEISNSVLKHFGYSERFTKEDAFRLSGLKWFEYFEFLLPKESYEKHLELQEACFEMSNSHPEMIGKTSEYFIPIKC